MLLWLMVWFISLGSPCHKIHQDTRGPIENKKRRFWQNAVKTGSRVCFFNLSLHLNGTRIGTKKNENHRDDDKDGPKPPQPPPPSFPPFRWLLALLSLSISLLHTITLPAYTYTHIRLLVHTRARSSRKLDGLEIGKGMSEIKQIHRFEFMDWGSYLSSSPNWQVFSLYWQLLLDANKFSLFFLSFLSWGVFFFFCCS